MTKPSLNPLSRTRLAASLLFYLIGILLVGLLSYRQAIRLGIAEYDNRLTSTVNAAELILPDELHTRATLEGQRTRATDMKLAMSVQRLVDAQDVAYLYTLFKKQDQWFFTSSNPTPEELNDPSIYKSAWMEEALDNNATYDQILNTGNPLFIKNSDQYGSFYSYIERRSAPDGTFYLIGADIDISNIVLLAKRSAIISAITAVIATLLILPLVFLLFASVLNQKNILIRHHTRDRLTGLPNRNRLLDDIHKIDKPRLTILDIDKFRDIATLHGPASGDNLIRQFAVFIDNYRHPDVKNILVYRLHSDEFAILISENDASSQEVLDNAIRDFYRSIVRQEFYLPGKKVRLNVYMGAASYHEDIYMLAYMALYEAKDRKETLVSYDERPNLPETYLANVEMKEAVIAALEEDRIAVFYQPIVDARTRRLRKVECLARIVDHHGNVTRTPYEFLPVMQRYRLYHIFSQRIIQQVFAKAKLHPELTFTVNISLLDVNHKPTRDFIIKTARSSRHSSQIEFEILEDECHQNLDSVSIFFNRLRSLGCRVGIDDLGKAHSNLDRLMRLPVDFIKLDGYVVSELVEDSDLQTFTQKALNYAKAKHLQTVAEYCSDTRIAAIAEKTGFDFLQGYCFGQPTPEIPTDESIARYMRENSDARRD